MGDLADTHMDSMIAVARRDPDKSRVTWKFNSHGEWQTTTGEEFLDLWDQPVAGTIYVDRVIVLP